MVLESWQNFMSIIVLSLAALAALLGLLFVNRLLKEKSKGLEGVILFTFSFLAVGYVCLALGELTRYLIFEVFHRPPSASMPDFYWVVGSLSLLVAFTTYSLYLHRTYGNPTKVFTLFLLSGLILGGVFLYFYSLGFFAESSSFGEQFLQYFYPLTTSLVLISSLSVYLFSDKLSYFQVGLLLLVAANVATLGGDLFYTYFNYAGYGIKGIYGLVGLVTDFFYIFGYGLYALAFFRLLAKLKEFHES